MKKNHFLILGLIVMTFQCLAQTETNTIKEKKANMLKLLFLSSSMLSESTGYVIKFDANGDGVPSDLKYTPQTRQLYLAKASVYYLEFVSSYNSISASLTQEQEDELKLIDESLAKVTKDTDYKILISKQMPALPLKDIFPTITFIEILKAKIDKLTMGMLK